MSNDADLEYGPTPAGAAYEHTDIAPGVAYSFAMWLGAAMLVSGAIVYGTFWFLEGRAVSIDDTVRHYPLAVGRAEAPPAPTAADPALQGRLRLEERPARAC